MRRRRVLATILLAAGSLICALALSELVVRVVRPQTLGIWAQTRDGLVVLRANARSQIDRYRVSVQTNSFGMRDREHPIEKPPGTFRILLLGDSFMEALQVPFEASLPHLLEVGLQRASAAPIEIVNASVSGWGTDDQLTYLSRYALRLDPDLILVAMTLYNDLSDNLRMNFHEFHDGDLVEKPRLETPAWRYAIQELKGFLASHSHLYFLASSAFRSGNRRAEGSHLVEFVSDLVRTSQPPNVVAGWSMTHKLLEKLVRTGQMVHANTAIFLVPMQMQVSDEGYSSFLTHNDLSGNEASPDLPQRVMRAWAERSGTPVIDLLPGFQQAMREGAASLYVEGDGHWNADGHRLAADVLGRELLRRQLVP